MKLPKRNKQQPITIVQGGQYGSEAKGLVTGYLAENEQTDICVRTGAVNAGHTVAYKGQLYKMQQLPVGWVNENTMLVIGAGALIHADILKRECEIVSRATGQDVRERLIIDWRAGVHNEAHTARSAASGRHHRIGATGKGSSEAIIDKIRGRGTDYRTFGQVSGNDQLYSVGDTVRYLNESYDHGSKIVIEGTQGTLLDLHLGPYPYVTHKPCSPAAWLAECGLSPQLPMDVVMVVRTFPIRVAGNSGHMPNEISWPILAREINNKLISLGKEPLIKDTSIVTFESAVRSAVARNRMAADKNVLDAMLLPPDTDGLDQHTWENRFKYQKALSELNAEALGSLGPDTLAELSKLFELTTVTKKLRRLARISDVELRYAANICRPNRVFVTFMNYEFPQHWFERPDRLDDRVIEYINRLEVVTRSPVTHVSFGPMPEHTYALHVPAQI